MRRPPRRHVRLFAAVSGFALVLAACGGDGGSSADEPLVTIAEPGEDVDVDVDVEDELESRTEVEQSSGTATSALLRQGFPTECPDTGEVLREMNDATYQVLALIDYQDQNGQQQTVIFSTGTAWAVGERLLATNAHVAAGFADSAAAGVQITRAVAVQAGTGEVVRLLRAIEHPSYQPFAPIYSPDVALFTTLEVLPTTLELAPDDSVLDLGDQIALVGFPGDVDQFVFNQPGLTVPQATSLTGAITARRSYDPTTAVDADTLDQYQHQAPTTPGTSGSAMTYCGLVVAVNNAGTVKQFVTPPRGEGEPFGVDRQAAANNNFAAHVKHVHELVSLFEADAIQGYELPVPAAANPQPQPGAGGGTASSDADEVGLPGTYRGSIVSGDLVNEIEFTVADDGSVTGISWWPATGQFTLTGTVDADGAFRIVDDAPERVGYRRGTYEGTFDGSGGFTGQYFEEGQEAARFDIAGGLAG